MRKPAKKLQRGIICQNGWRTGTKRLKGGPEAIQRTIDVQVKCHIANKICIFFSWGSRKILRACVSKNRPEEMLDSPMLCPRMRRRRTICSRIPAPLCLQCSGEYMPHRRSRIVAPSSVTAQLCWLEPPRRAILSCSSRYPRPTHQRMTWPQRSKGQGGCAASRW